MIIWNRRQNEKNIIKQTKKKIDKLIIEKYAEKDKFCLIKLREKK